MQKEAAMAQPIPQAVSADERQLVEGALRRDESAVRSIIQQHNRRLFRMARSIVRDDGEAEDVVQEAYVNAFSKLDTFRGDSSLATWLGRIVINEALGRLRRRRSAPIGIPLETLEAVGRSAEVIPFPLASRQPDPEQSMAQQQIRSVLESAIDDLPEPFRVVLVARVVEEMSIEETAQLLDLRPETVKTRLHRARKLLQTALEKQVGPVLTDAFPFDGRRCQRMADVVVRRIGLGR
jgi:RNA polymerase sigma-70 factor (ECF subfamily)